MESTAASNFARPADWMFRSRVDGRITVVQPPNLPLWLFLATVLARVVLHPGGATGVALALVSAGVLLAWCILEILRGVNPFRRLLGAGVALVQLVMLFSLL